MNSQSLIDLPAIYRQPHPEPEFVRALPGLREEYLRAIFRLFYPEQEPVMAFDYIRIAHRPLTVYEQAYTDRLESWQDQLAKRAANENEAAFQVRQRRLMASPGVALDIYGEYKIHLQVVEGYKPYVLRKLCFLLLKDQWLAELVRAFKLAATDGGGHYPELVIYIHPATPPLYQQANQSDVEQLLRLQRHRFNRALARLWHYFSQDDKPLGKDSVPRYNARLSDLICVAQSGGDLKEALGPIAGHYFDARLNFAFRHGELPPTVPLLNQIIAHLT